jgi:hypothetical protein
MQVLRLGENIWKDPHTRKWTLGVMNLMGQDTENCCKRELNLVGVKGSDRKRLAINQQMIVRFSVE